MLKFVIGDDAVDNSVIPRSSATCRPFRCSRAPAPRYRNSGVPHADVQVQRGSAGGEIQWLVNGKPFDPTCRMAYPKQGSGELWTIRNGGGGWVHPVHFHMEEHRVISRGGGMAAGRLLKGGRCGVGPGESVTFYRRFRTFTGKYVAHCHNLAHEDHAMMFGWEIVP